MHVLPPSVTGNEKKFIESFNSTKIAKCSQNDIETVLKASFVRIGLRGQNLPNGLEKDVLLNEITECYSNLTIQQFNQAFELLTRQDLDIESTAYENFSVEYLHKVMKSYLRWSSKVYKENEKFFNKDLVEQTNLLPAEKLTPDEILELSKEIFASTKNLMFIDPRCYDILKLELSNEDKQKIRIEAKVLLGKIYEHDNKEITEKEVTRVCKKIALARFYFSG